MESKQLLSMHLASRCQAKSKRSGVCCKNPAVKGHKVCRMHGAGGGPPKGNKNALKHGQYSRATIEATRLLNAINRLARKTLGEL